MQANLNWRHAKRSVIMLLFCCLALTGCIRAEQIQPKGAQPEAAQPEATTPPPAISVAGSYDTAVTLAENNCGPVTVEPMPTQVEQQPGETSLVLTHAGNHFNGILQPDATFITEPLILRGGGDTYTVTVQGHFATTGFDALTTVIVQQSVKPQNCQYTVRWLGTKQGAPNVIP
jgi:hypothetical protein